jgi:hypothetical protein
MPKMSRVFGLLLTPELNHNKHAGTSSDAC